MQQEQMNWECSKCGTVVSGRNLQPSSMPALRLGKCWRCKVRRNFQPTTRGADTPPKAKPAQLQALSPSGAVARTTDPATSWDAARSIEPEALRASQAQVLDILRQHGPMTDKGIYRYIDDEQSVSGARTRRSELVDAGLVRDSGARALTATGRKTIVWEVT